MLYSGDYLEFFPDTGNRVTYRNHLYSSKNPNLCTIYFQVICWYPRFPCINASKKILLYQFVTNFAQHTWLFMLQEEWHNIFFMLHQYLRKLNTFFNSANVVNFFHSLYIYCKCQNFPQSSSVQGVHINPTVSAGSVCKFHENPICRGRIPGRNSDKSLESFRMW